MPVEKLTEAQAEAIRRDGVCRDTGITAQWGYHPKADARVFYLKDGEALPKGLVGRSAKSRSPSRRVEPAQKPTPSLSDLRWT
jgi:hypothetical protein